MKKHRELVQLSWEEQRREREDRRKREEQEENERLKQEMTLNAQKEIILGN